MAAPAETDHLDVHVADGQRTRVRRRKGELAHHLALVGLPPWEVEARRREGDGWRHGGRRGGVKEQKDMPVESPPVGGVSP